MSKPTTSNQARPRGRQTWLVASVAAGAIPTRLYPMIRGCRFLGVPSKPSLYCLLTRLYCLVPSLADALSRPQPLQSHATMNISTTAGSFVGGTLGGVFLNPESFATEELTSGRRMHMAHLHVIFYMSRHVRPPAGPDSTWSPASFSKG